MQAEGSGLGPGAASGPGPLALVGSGEYLPVMAEVFPDASVAKISTSFALDVPRGPLVEVVTEAPLEPWVQPSKTAEAAMPDNSITMIPGLITPPEVV